MLKQTNILKSAIVLSIIASSSLYATNGDTLIGVGAKTRAMGGAGIALGHGAESTLVNPATITSIDRTEISFGGTIFLPSIKTDIGPSGTFTKSDSDTSMIPAVAIASKLKNNIYVGIGMYGTAGMGVDFRKSSNPLFAKMETTLQLMQFVAPVAYKINNLSIGIAPIIQYGSLDINRNATGYGQKQDFGYGFSLGTTYNFENGFSIGAVYKSKIKMNYAKVISTVAPGFKDYLDQPAEIGIGVAYKSGPHTIAIDYKKIKWSSARGYKEFGWKDQNVYAIGYEYNAGVWAARVGFNHASSPIALTSGATAPEAMLNYFNLLGFPATAKNHFTVGGTYNFSKNFSTDFTLVYSPEEKTTANLTAMAPGATITNKHSELGATIQFNYKF